MVVGIATSQVKAGTITQSQNRVRLHDPERGTCVASTRIRFAPQDRDTTLDTLPSSLSFG